MTRRDFLTASGAVVIGASVMDFSVETAVASHHGVVASTPPMGWNSWDCFGASVVESEVKANADYMAKNLLKYGWEYVTVDIQWYEPTAISHDYHAFAKLDMDVYGRLTPAENRFPSASNGVGFASLSKYCHDHGLKFGIHILRGIARQAVDAKSPVLGTNLTAEDIADTSSTCPWNTDMYGVDASKPGAQEYYDSLLSLYKSWGVDFIKVDDLSQPYHKGEIELIHSAIQRIDPQIAFSTSPGPTPRAEAEHISAHANMWRMSGDFWDNWGSLRHAFDLCSEWQGAGGPGHWPDCDMLPLGQLNLCSNNGRTAGNGTNFTRDEQVLLMSLWCIFKSPLIFGGNLPDNDDWTLALITNSEVLNMHRDCTNSKELTRNNDGDKVASIVWTADGKHGSKYVALFNVCEELQAVTTAVPIDSDKIVELWGKTDFSVGGGEINCEIPSHGVKLFKVG